MEVPFFFSADSLPACLSPAVSFVLPGVMSFLSTSLKKFIASSCSWSSCRPSSSSMVQLAISAIQSTSMMFLRTFRSASFNSSASFYFQSFSSDWPTVKLFKDSLLFQFLNLSEAIEFCLYNLRRAVYERRKLSCCSSSYFLFLFYLSISF